VKKNYTRVKCLALGCLIFLTGCGKYHVTVYGASGRAFVAPDICAAYLACKNSTETSCYYDKTLYTNAAGETQESGCKEVKK
jgi:hypothetical protein